MIANPNAIVQPGAMMIEAFDATIADGTMPRARCAQDKAIWAHFTWVDLSEQFKEVVLLSEIARVTSRGNEEAYCNDWA